MNVILACLIVLLTASQTLAEEMEFNEDSFYPYSDQIQAELVEDPVFERYLLRPARRPKSEKFYPIIGKRNNDFKETSPKRNKIFIGLMGKRSLPSGHNFIGLMGKRALTAESEERMNDLYFSRRHTRPVTSNCTRPIKTNIAERRDGL
ncbi:tachykinin-like peptide [Xenopus laevis]|uniref:Tachykinin-like peptide n=1 Tax=Xenopus laevis TaxID=8355 RepID=A0A8J1KYP2_XENLA|nr:tachykinin-like peptide [Xenopus laevis]